MSKSINYKTKVFLNIRVSSYNLYKIKHLFFYEFKTDVPLIENKLYYAGHKIETLVSDTVITPLLKQGPNIIIGQDNIFVNYIKTKHSLKSWIIIFKPFVCLYCIP